MKLRLPWQSGEVCHVGSIVVSMALTIRRESRGWIDMYSNRSGSGFACSLICVMRLGIVCLCSGVLWILVGLLRNKLAVSANITSGTSPALESRSRALLRVKHLAIVEGDVVGLRLRVRQGLCGA